MLNEAVKSRSTLKADNMDKPIKLFSQGGSTSIHIDMRLEESGDLIFSGQDIYTATRSSLLPSTAARTFSGFSPGS